jgi:di/tricarboxylate transporter
MTFEIALVLIILIAAVILFVTERVRMDVVAMLVLAALGFTGLLAPADALSGFSNPAVITVLAMFIIGGGLSRTGVAAAVGGHILRLAGVSESRLIIVIMISAGVMSAFMNNVGVAAMMLPVVMDLARRSRNAPSRLLMPLAYGTLLGGMTTLIGTPPNLLISDALLDHGLKPFGLFDYAPVGLTIMVAGILYMVFFGRHLLPKGVGSTTGEMEDDARLDVMYAVKEHLFHLRIPDDSPLSGRNLVQCKLGKALDLNVIAVMRQGRVQLAPGPDYTLQGGDTLVVQGETATLEELRSRSWLTQEQSRQTLERLSLGKHVFYEGEITADSSFIGQSLRDCDLRRHHGVVAIAIQRGDNLRRTNFHDIPLQAGDGLLLLGPKDRVEALADVSDLRLLRAVEQDELMNRYFLHERFLGMPLDKESYLAGRTLEESRLGDVWGMFVLGIIRNGDVIIMPEADTTLREGDTLMVKGRSDELNILRGLQELIIQEAGIGYDEIETPDIGLAEVMLSPHGNLFGQTLRRLHFREKFDLTVLAIWREGKAYHDGVRDMHLRMGDALLVYGAREKVQILGQDPGFLVLTETAQEQPRSKKAPMAAAIMAAVLLPVLFEWTPIAISGMMGAALMVLTGCLKIEEAYRYIELRVIFLIAGMLPLGLALEQTGAAQLIADSLIAIFGGLGPRAVMAVLFLLATLGKQAMPNSVVAVLMAPIALNAAADMGMSPYALLMTVAVASASSFLSPVSHPANMLVMGPGGYRYGTYLKVGLPLILLTLVLVLTVLPLFWPL